MSVRSGHKTSRNPMTTYRGFCIIQVIEIDYERSIFDPTRFSNWPKRKEVHYDFCKEGDEKKPSKHYGSWAANVKECKECIDNFINDDSIYFTAEERKKYVSDPNHKCDWSYGYDSLMKIMREHQKADKRMKILLEDRLTDANFHSEASFLAQHDYDGYTELVKRDYPFKEKFEVYTFTECKPIKDPKRLEAHIKSAIEEYFKAHKMDVGNTSVKVKYCEVW